MSETEVAYPIGHGLFYTDPVKDIKVNVPASAQLDQPFTATVTLSGLNGLEKMTTVLPLRWIVSISTSCQVLTIPSLAILF